MGVEPLSSSSELLAAWSTLAHERRELQHDIRRHGVNSQARARLMRLDSVLCGKLLDISDRLRAEGIDPNKVSAG